MDYAQLYAGLTAGATTTLLLHPLDYIKTQMQVNLTNAKLDFRVRSKLYNGLSANLLGNSLSWGFYFLFYDLMKKEIGNRFGSMSYFMAAIPAGMATVVLTNPIWLIKTRMITMPEQFPNFLASFSRTLRHEGIRGFYKGLGPGLIGTSHGAVQFMVYEMLKERSDHSTLAYTLASVQSKVIATVVTYPYQVLRARQQRSRETTNLTSMIRDIIKKEGLRGFYKGLSAGCIRVLPATVITFTVYEAVQKALK